eukprot:11245111-Heterocapsa_arctica.AAC.1
MDQGEVEVGKREHAQDDRDVCERVGVRAGQALQEYAGSRVVFRHEPELDSITGAMEAAILVDPEGRCLGRQHHGEQALKYVHAHLEQGHGVPQLRGQVLAGHQDGSDEADSQRRNRRKVVDGSEEELRT